MTSKCDEKRPLNKDEEILEPTAQDFELQEIQEGNKTYYKLAGLMISKSAYQSLHNLATGKGLRIRLNAGGCSGYKYSYDFFDQPQEDEREYQLSEKLAIYMNDFTFTKSQDAVVDFTIGLHGSGLKIVNPKAKRSCSCGVSMGF